MENLKNAKMMDVTPPGKGAIEMEELHARSWTPALSAAASGRQERVASCHLRRTWRPTWLPEQYELSRGANTMTSTCRYCLTVLTWKESRIILTNQLHLGS